MSSGKFGRKSKPAIIFDNGSGVLKVGKTAINPAKDPPELIPCVVGHAKHEAELFTDHTVQTTPHCGRRATKNRGLFRLQHPVQRGYIQDWDAMTHLWEWAYRGQLTKSTDIFKYSPDHNVLIVEQPRSNPKARLKTAERFFEYFRAPGIYFANSGVLSMLATGRTTGIVFDCGHGTTTATPVFDGKALPHCITYENLAGQDVTDYLNERLYEQHGESLGRRFHTTAELDLVREMKENVCYILDGSDVMQAHRDTEYDLPDGTKIKIRDIQHQAPEILFNPLLQGRNCKPIQKILVSAIEKCDKSIRRHVAANVVVCGGTTSLQNFETRLQQEVDKLEGPHTRIWKPEDGDKLAWIGGSILSYYPSFQKLWVTRKEYNEIGPSAVLRH